MSERLSGTSICDREPIKSSIEKITGDHKGSFSFCERVFLKCSPALRVGKTRQRPVKSPLKRSSKSSLNFSRKEVMVWSAISQKLKCIGERFLASIYSKPGCLFDKKASA